MKHFLLFTFLFLQSTVVVYSQNLRGQWKGEFMDKSTKYMSWGGDKCEYVLDLEFKGKEVSGFSYTYFTEGGKRFFTICRLEGILNKKNKSIEIKEVERTKTNVPAEINNCFQIHKLTYFKNTNGDETLEGNWSPAPNQKGNCGYGITNLSRRSLAKTIPGFKSPLVKSNPKVYTASSNKNLPDLSDKNKSLTNNTKPVTVKPKTTISNAVLPKKEAPLKPTETIKEPNIKLAQPTITTPGLFFEKRSTTVLKTIEVETENIKIDLYDNGEVDGDSVSLFLNGKLLVTRKKLTTQPLSIRIPKNELEDENELVMYAENLGTIAPNTALMVVTDGSKRYEVRITSDLQKSGTIRFVKKK